MRERWRWCRKAEEYRRRRFLTYSAAYLLIMAAGCRIRHYELSHNCSITGLQPVHHQTAHLDLPYHLSCQWLAVNDPKAMPLAQLESGKSGGMFSRH
jgi:hypothetical protein